MCRFVETVDGYSFLLYLFASIEGQETIIVKTGIIKRIIEKVDIMSDYSESIPKLHGCHKSFEAGYLEAVN